MFYKQNGYYIAKDVFTKQSSQLMTILQEIDTIIVQQLQRFHVHYAASSDKELIYQHMAKLLSLDSEAYLASLKLCAQLFSVQSLLMAPQLINILKSFGIALPCIPTTPVLHVLGDDLKIPGGYYGIGVHQDWPSLQASLDAIVIWIPLMTVTKDNFPVEILPGSHLAGLYPGKPVEHLYEIDASLYNENDFIPAEVALGDVLFMSSFLLHRSGVEGKSGFRMACSNRYENASEKTFIERAYPHAQKRVVQRELIFGDFPNADQIKEVFSYE